jgi:hypothetical protein
MALGADPTVALGTGAGMCAALKAEDFTAVGLSPDPTPPRPPNSVESTGARCTCTKAFPIAGGLELDIFDGASDPAGVVKTMPGLRDHDPAERQGQGAAPGPRRSGAGAREALTTVARHQCVRRMPRPAHLLD